jgi:hypothetical protein
MVQRVQVQLVDDLTGQEAQESVRFGLDGLDYEIDLTTDNAEALRSTLLKYVGRGRKASKARKSQDEPDLASASTSRSKRGNTQQIRRWAQDNGYNLSARGRIPQSIIDAYNENH